MKWRPAPPLRLRFCERGATAIETGLVLMLLVIFFLGIFEFGFGFWVWHTMRLAAAEGARCAMVSGPGNLNPPCRDDTATQALVQQWLPAVLFGDPNQVQMVHGTLADGTPTTTITITYQNDFLNVWPYSLRTQVVVPVL